MRRKDREMDATFAKQVIDRSEYGVLSMIREDGSPYGIPLSLVRREDVIYFHCAKQGEKIDALRGHPQVSLCCTADIKRLPEQFSTEFASAVVFGTANEVVDEQEKTEALRLLCLKYAPDHMHLFEDEIAKSLKHTAIWAVAIESITGKRKKMDVHGKEMKHGRME